MIYVVYMPKGSFPLLPNFYVRKEITLTRLNKMETMYGRSRLYAKVEPCSTFTFMRGL